MAPTERAVLKRLLDEYDELDRLRGRLAKRPEQEEARRLRRESRRHIDAIGRALRDLPEGSVLGDLLQRYRLTKYQFVLLLALLRRRLVDENPYLRGRELLSLLFEGSFDILKGTRLLDTTGILQTAGLVVPDVRDEDAEDDLLETPFKLSDRVYRLVRGTFRVRSGPKLPTGRKRVLPYRNNLAYVLDLRRLSLLYRKRASKIFDFDYWEDVGLGTAESVGALNEQISRFRTRVETALEKTTRAREFPARRLQLEYGLDEAETVVLVTLLFNELLEGSPFLDAVDLVKLVSASEEDLLRKRRFLGKRSRLVRHNLVAIEEMVNDKDLTAEVYLPNWVVDRLLGPEGREAIDADLRLDFHEYIKRIESADDFFEDLDASE